MALYRTRQTERSLTMTPEPLAVALRVIDTFDDLEVSYHVGGSFASSIHGVPRQTHDIDLVADLSLEKIPELVQRLRDEFYIDADMIRSALRRQASFNVIHLDSGFKVDIFPVGPGAFDQSEISRSIAHQILENHPLSIMVKSAEDTLLRKLQWYRLGNEVSDRQWHDIVGIVRTQGDRLDRDYLRHWATDLGVKDLLERLELFDQP